MTDRDIILNPMVLFLCGHKDTIITNLEDVGPDMSMAEESLCPTCEREHDDELFQYKDIDPCFHCHNLGMGDYSRDGDVSCAGCSYNAEFPPGSPRTKNQEIVHRIKTTLYYGFHRSIVGRLYRQVRYNKCPF